jgi:AcrR family transcriptional regulator
VTALTIPSKAPGNARVEGQTVSGSTRERILDAALSSIAAKGYDGTSLDGLANGVGFTKQTILHHFGSKDGLLRAVLERSAGELREAVAGGLRRTKTDDRSTEGVLHVVDQAVRASFRLAARRPELIALTREVARLGGQQTVDLLTVLDPLTAVAGLFLNRAIRDGAVRSHDSRSLLLGMYARIIGAATEVEVMRQLGVEPPLRILVRRQNGLIEELHRALNPDAS